MPSVTLCRIEDVEEGSALRVEPEGLPPLAVFNLDGEFFVMDDTCSHGEASLCDGEIEDGQIDCPWHHARFCIRTGKALTFPAVVPQKTYAVSVEAGEVRIEV